MIRADISEMLASDKYTLDADGNPVQCKRIEEYWEWHNALPDDIRTGIGFTLRRTERDGVTVSTVYLGSDHWMGHGPRPVLWETMVFGDKSDGEICVRYCTRDEAIVGHNRLCGVYLFKSPQ